MLKKSCFAVILTGLLLCTLILTVPSEILGAGNVVTTYFEANFSNYDSSLWEKADWDNGDMFNCMWRPSQVTINNGKMVLTLDRDYDPSHHYPYKSGEYRTKSFFGFGYYEVRMKPAKNPGIVSSFFTYTGPSDGNPWDEIDIEFLGKDTTKVQFNWWKNGQGNNEYYYDLGFDASQSFNTYGFDWKPNSIDFYVNGVKVYTGTRNIPQTPGKIMMNLWPGIGVDDWLEPFNGRTPLTAEYEYVKYYPNGFPGNQQSPQPQQPWQPQPQPQQPWQPQPQPQQPWQPPASVKSAFNTIQANDFDDTNASNIQIINTDNGRGIGYIENGNTVTYRNVDFENGVSSFSARVASDMNFPTEIEIIVNGTTLGSLSVSSTGGWNNYRELSTNVRNITGVHDLVLRFSGPVNVDSFLFSSSSGAPQQPEPQQPWQPQPQPQPQQPGDTGNLSISVSENTWGGGATLNVTITNNGSTAVNGWTANLNFSGDVKVTSSWNANLNQSGSSVSVSNVDWNSTIQPGASVTFGFNISYSGSYSRPSASVK
ncbi:hypothetical protein B9R14_05900 [Acetivibrio saccincola]|uniref:Beta-glucanase n=1 Tax=Acetivibrio saccincola TaxID=1677857 RepID=A0A2K9EPB5_9FIRM|nr:Beta-glucanase precursor [Acetivibrio saccincola]PQQ66328.1 hypothetical protein B9R14_05900 [Acetivibrio saccincola]